MQGYALGSRPCFGAARIFASSVKWRLLPRHPGKAQVDERDVDLQALPEQGEGLLCSGARQGSRSGDRWKQSRRSTTPREE